MFLTRYIPLLLLAASALAEAAPTCLRYDDASVTLTGKLVIHTYYGPPNYGENPETDSKEPQALLRLDRPFCVAESANDEAEHGQSKLTLVPMGKINLSKYAGEQVSVSGRLFHANSAHHHTPILMELQRPPKFEK